ncbi:monofunctional biosynthetic peptidoglycan transglycosylase [Azospirillum halopraeferens]|uniref:monofunctional biosynthetic peptidoglycan transglycosylase n=1 Tax=Azospirillum halopraeferens TaxID=34010 RepID=UPI000408E9FD|nr:monofunctional biosynthetic peptidoglycan transglycosylase [Azospirillum halopraeferens]
MREWLRRARRTLAALVLALVAVSIGWVMLYRVVPPPVTALMLLRAAAGAGIDHTPVPLDAVSPHLVRAVIASEDSRFCRHGGFDVPAIRAALAGNREGGGLRGASTISMQTAKNVFLWPDRTWLRKGAEAWFTLLIETLWPKARILEVYLNVAEWGDGIYGAEAAARAHFGKPAAELGDREAALLAVVLPSPRSWSASQPGPYVSRRSGVIRQRMAIVARDRLDDCVWPDGAPTAPGRPGSG